MRQPAGFRLIHGTAPGLLSGGAVLLAMSGALAPFRSHLSVATPALVLIVPVVVAALYGGRRSAMALAVLSAAVFDFVFLRPRGSLRITVAQDAAAFVAFLVVGMIIGTVVAREVALRRTATQRADELAQMHAHLEAAIAERDRLEVETRRVAVLQEVDRQRSALLRAVSHDLRTPLGTIHAIASDLQADTPFDTATRAGLVELLLSESARLDRIVTNLLSLSRIEAGAFEPELGAVDLAELVHVVTRRLKSALRHVELHVDIPMDLPPALADYTQLDLVLTNVLENAARHAPDESVVTVRARVCDAATIRIDVCDDGPGIAPSQRDEVFEPFRSWSGGTGIGLSICRAIVLAHGGSIGIESGEHNGGHFVVRLPTAF
jgi:K+-sensing histidine kinase KdpD